MALFTYPKFQAPNINGVNLSGGLVYFYEIGTSTAKDTYSDKALSSANANPVVLDSRGEADIFLSGEYKVVLKDSDDVTIWTIDPYFEIGALEHPLVNIQTASYTAVRTDDLKFVGMNVATANNFTVPPFVDVGLPIGTTLVICQLGVGTTTIVAGAGVTINTSSTLDIYAQYDTIGAFQYLLNTWVITGAFA